MRFSSGGLREWGTYLGGDGVDVAQSCAIDPSGNLYVAGYTSSRPDIATSGVHQASYGGGEMDAFLVKFAAGGERLWGTYYGGSGKDQGYACAVEPTGGAVYLAGRTESFENIATPSAHQPTFGYGAYDALLVRFSSTGQRQWGTYYGGVGQDEAFDCVVDGEGTVYIAGRTWSLENIASADAYQPVASMGGNGFVVRFAANGRRIWGTYYGGEGGDEIHACTVVQSYLYFTGETNAPDGLATAGTHQSQLNPGSCGIVTCPDAFLIKVEVGRATLSRTDPTRSIFGNISPIPARDEIVIFTEQPIEIEVYDLQGQCVDRWTITGRGHWRFPLNLPPGMYWAREQFSFSTHLLLIQP